MRRVVRREITERKAPALTEPMHGVLVGVDFYYIGTSGWEPHWSMMLDAS